MTMSQTHESQLSKPDVTPAADEPFDPHRFDAEPRHRASRLLPAVIIGFVVLMALAGASVMITKRYLADYMTERAQQRMEEKRMKQPTEDSGRQGKVFADASTPTALPLAFGQPKAASVPLAGSATPDESASAIPVLARAQAGEGGAGAPGTSPPPRPSLMVPSGVAPDSVAVTVPPAVVSVEQQAARVAEKASPTATAQASAANLGNRSLLLARGAFVPCVLETQLVSGLRGSASCILPQHVYSDDGKVLLLEKGSSIVGVYDSGVRAGDARIAILWQRIKTATGVVIDVDSEASDQVGVTGAPGVLDNHWPERIGAAFLLSLVEDAAAIEVARNSRGGAVAGQNTISSTATLSEKVLDATINIPPTLYKNRGDRLMVFVNRDLWFNRVYALRSVQP